ncbi:MAG: hypothetical protein LQ348_001671 [Seirophora lacunosa]|nr:MAG: hypothetical protein LQ348_001671 [Seirophora lacunosa]
MAKEYQDTHWAYAGVGSRRCAGSFAPLEESSAHPRTDTHIRTHTPAAARGFSGCVQWMRAVDVGEAEWEVECEVGNVTRARWGWVGAANAGGENWMMVVAR